jgi:hypothetical protein
VGSPTLKMMLLTGSHRLANGVRVRLRYPHARDRAAVGALHARLGLPADELEVRRMLSFDLRHRRVVVAVAWVDGVETLVGAAGGSHAGDPAPDVLLADEALAPGITELLRAALDELVSARVA